jgi:hypothetical protein
LTVVDFSAAKSQFPLVDVVARYVELKSTPTGWKGLCPFHADRDPSFQIYTSSDGFDRYRCFACDAGAEGGDVIDFIAAIEGVDSKKAYDILTGGKMPEVGKMKRGKPKDNSRQWSPIVPAPDDAPEYDPRHTFNVLRDQVVCHTPTRVDTYFDADGRILCHVSRLEFNDGGKSCLTITYCEGPGGVRHWAAKRMDEPYPLQGLDQLAARPNAVVLLVSGEKCYDYALKHLPQLVPVSWMGGDGGIEKTDLSPLRGRWIRAWPDADFPGVEAMLKAYNLIEKAGSG